MPGQSTSVMTYGPSHSGESFVVVLVALDEVEHQVPNVEGPTPHSTAVVPAQCLLVLGQAEEGNVVCFI